MQNVYENQFGFVRKENVYKRLSFVFPAKNFDLFRNSVLPSVTTIASLGTIH